MALDEAKTAVVDANRGVWVRLDRRSHTELSCFGHGVDLNTYCDGVCAHPYALNAINSTWKVWSSFVVIDEDVLEGLISLDERRPVIEVPDE
jgi:hypothetical protein